MTLRMLMAAGAFGLTSSTALASDIMFSEVNVTAVLTAIQDPQAVEFWTSLEDDLESTLLALLSDQLVDDGARLVVDITEFMTGDVSVPFSVEDAALGGRVHVIDPGDQGNFESYELKLRIAGMTTTLDGAQIAVSQMQPEDAYDRLVAAYGESVVDRLD
ncbi:MAG: hypothetical protein JJU09_08455 [Rhodobacteraceae bacterium]|nr:hypothetical protein [Paracoccaceae bacterium]